MTKNQETKQTESIEPSSENLIYKLGCFFSGVGGAVGFRTLAHESLKQDRRERAIKNFYATPTKFRKDTGAELPAFKYQFGRAASRGVLGGVYAAFLGGAFFTGVATATNAMAKGFLSYTGQGIKANESVSKNKPY